MKSAVCVLIPSNTSPDAYLAVSRRKSTTSWGLPGGKVDQGETNLNAIVRETFEETGLKLDPLMMEPLYSAVCPGKGPDDTYWVTTYIYKGDAPLTKNIVPEADLIVDWKDQAMLCLQDHSPFAAYNCGVFQAYQQFQGQ